jgi:hypothetical protein
VDRAGVGVFSLLHLREIPNFQGGVAYPYLRVAYPYPGQGRGRGG